MKKILLITAILFSSLFLQAQPDSIPNAGFEAWWFWAGWGPEPSMWTTNNSQLLAANVVMDTISHSGTLAMQLINSGNFRPLAFCGFPLDHHPLTLTGYYKNNLWVGDTALVRVILYHNNLPVDSSTRAIPGGVPVATYYSFVLPISQNSIAADSCEIILEGGNVYLSAISFDDLSLTFPTGIEEHASKTFSVFPNPCNERLLIRFNETWTSGRQVVITDVSGKKIMKAEIKDGKRETSINTAGLAAGIYVVTVRIKDQIYSLPIIKN